MAEKPLESKWYTLVANHIKAIGDGSLEEEKRAKAAGELAALAFSDSTNERMNRQNLIVEDNARAKKLAEVQTQQTKREAVKVAAPARKAAAPTKSKAGTKKLTDYLSEDFGKMSDAEYMKWIESKIS